MTNAPFIVWSERQDPESWDTDGVQSISKDFYDAIRLEERKAIAAWLRKYNYQQIADAIEAKEHLK